MAGQIQEPSILDNSKLKLIQQLPIVGSKAVAKVTGCLCDLGREGLGGKLAEIVVLAHTSVLCINAQGIYWKELHTPIGVV